MNTKESLLLIYFWLVPNLYGHHHAQALFRRVKDAGRSQNPMRTFLASVLIGGGQNFNFRLVNKCIVLNCFPDIEVYIFFTQKQIGHHWPSLYKKN